MLAVVANVPDSHAGRVFGLWHELESRFGVFSELTESFPHVSLHVADAYRSSIHDRLDAFVARRRPLPLRTCGLGLFSDSRTVFYVSVEHDAPLTHFHGDLWRALDGVGSEVHSYYEPEQWIPHITLAPEGLHPGNVDPVRRWLSSQPLDWSFDVTSLSLLETGGVESRELERFELSG